MSQLPFRVKSLSAYSLVGGEAHLVLVKSLETILRIYLEALDWNLVIIFIIYIKVFSNEHLVLINIGVVPRIWSFEVNLLTSNEGLGLVV